MAKKYPAYSDKELVTLFQDKEHAEGAFTEIYHRYSSMVHAYCLRILNNQEQAEDIFQETFIRFYQNVNTGYANTNIPGFLIKISRNLCLNYKRDKRPVVSFENFENLIETSNSYEQKELLDLITRSLDLLDDDFRECFVLREYDNLPYKEIAEITGISVSNAKSRVFRARQKIKQILSPYLKDLCK